MKRYGLWVEEVPTNATGTAVAGTGDDDSTVVVKKKPKIFKRKRRLTKEQIEEGIASRAADMAKQAAKKKAGELKKKAVGAVKSKLKSTGPARAFYGAKSKVKAAQDALDKAKEKKKKMASTYRKLRGEESEDDLAERNYAKERENYHSKPEQMERNAARLRARRLMIKNGKAARGDGKDVHHKDNDPLNNEEDNLKVTDRSWNRREPRLRKEESINIEERTLTPTELKRREEIAKDLDDAKFKEKYGEKWKQVKMGVATNLAKKESVDEADMKKDPKANKELGKELKIKKAIAQAQLSMAKDAERVQKLNDLLTKKKEKQKTDESTMSKKYLETKQGSIEDVIKQVWQNAADAVPATPPKVENWKDDEDEKEEVQPEKKSQKVDGRSKSYKETLKRIALRKEKLAAMNASVKKMNAVAKGLDEEDLDEAKFKSGDVEKAIKIAYDMEGNMTGAWKKIEKIKRGLGDEPTVKAALQDANEEVVHEAVKGHFDAMDNKEMKKSLAKFRLKGKISQKDVNPGQDEWEVSGKSIEDIWKWYTKSGYGDADDFEDMDDFKDTHFESRVHHRAMVTEGTKEEYQKFFQAALKKFGAKSPAELEGEKKKSFFDYIDKNWTKEEQQDFSEGELPPALKKAIAAKKAQKKDSDEQDEDPVGESIRPTPKPRGDLDKAITKFKKGGGKTTKLKPGARLKGMEKKRKDVVKGRMAREEYIHEGTWAIPGKQKDYDKFMKLMQKPIPAGDAEKKYFNTIGDDEVWDEVEKILDKKGPKGDIRPAFKDFFNDTRMVAYMQKKGIKLHKHKKNYDGQWVIESAESRFIHEAKSPMDELRKIVDKRTAGKVSGMKVDLFSASAMVAVYNALNPQNQTKVEQMLKTKQGVLTFAEFAMSNVK